MAPWKYLAESLLANTLATGGTLVTLILIFVSGAHFDPAATLADASQGGIRWREVPGYIAAQRWERCLASGRLTWCVTRQ